MKKELEDKLYNEFPLIFGDRDKPMSETCMCWGIECGDGWYNLIQDLCQTLQFYTDTNKYPQVIAIQVKEKFGSLRFYYNTISQEDVPYKKGYICGIVDTYCNFSEIVCECCGQPGTMQNINGWLTTICSKCKKKRK